MDLLPRGEIDSLLAADMVCFRLTVSGDSLEVVRQDRGVPTPVYNFPGGFFVVSTDSTDTWIGEDDSSFGYRIRKNSFGLPVLLALLGGEAFMEWVWENDSSVTTYSLDSSGNRIDIDILPLFKGTAIRLDEQGDLEYFKYETLSASGWMYSLDSSHRVLSKRAVDVSGETVSTSDGLFETVYTYDSSGNLTSTRFFDRDGNLLPGEYAVTTTGNYLFDSNGVVVNEEKIAFTEQLFDENSLYILERYIGTDGNLIENPSGVASTVFQREIQGGISESAWFDIEGARTEIEGISVTRRLFNNQGRVIESSTYDADLEIADFPGGFAYTRFSYAADGQPELISYYNSYELPVINTSLGCHARSFSYNSESACVELRYLDTAYDLINLATGYARVVSVFDVEGNLVEHIFFDQYGAEVLP